MSLEERFTVPFVASLALREKQIQQAYRPIIGIHKWFARRPGSVFRSLMLAEFGDALLGDSYWEGHDLKGVIADPFMGGGTTIYEATRLGFSTVGVDLNPMAWWLVRQATSPVEPSELRAAARSVRDAVQAVVGDLYRTEDKVNGQQVPVKYFLWVKTLSCPACEAEIRLFPGYRLAKNVRHPMHVLVCSDCGELNEVADLPSDENKPACAHCSAKLKLKGAAKRRRSECRSCGEVVSYERPSEPLEHRMWAIEYHSPDRKKGHKGRFFKTPDKLDLERAELAAQMLAELPDLALPAGLILEGDETTRLRRWGYTRWQQLFSPRQLLTLGLLRREIAQLPDERVREALITVFSDCLRYQNMLCRYDIYALKCQDIFSVHGFPVGLTPCENNVLGIPRVGSGGFMHFVEKYIRAVEYAQRPFETRFENGKKTRVHPDGETIHTHPVSSAPTGAESRHSFLRCASSTEVDLDGTTLDGVFTDPPYFANVQYAELMDFNHAWIRGLLEVRYDSFSTVDTRRADELTGNATAGRGLEHFTQGISDVFRRFAARLRPGAPFVFTYHHNDPTAYVPLVVAILDAEMTCTATLPVVGEMSASIHIAGTGSSTVDSVFVCRRVDPSLTSPQLSFLDCPDVDIAASLKKDIEGLVAGGVAVRKGEIACLTAGHVARHAILALRMTWNSAAPVDARIAVARLKLESIADIVRHGLKSPTPGAPEDLHAAL